MAEIATAPTAEEYERPPVSAAAPATVPGAVSLDTIANIAQRQYGPRGLYADAARIARERGVAQQPVVDKLTALNAAPLSRAEPTDPTLLPPPSKGLHAFLAPVEGESPMASIQKLVGALGTFASGLGIKGSAHGAAKASLAALNGAMHGWEVGDKERADRAFADWKAQSETALQKWEIEDKSYTRALTKKGLDRQALEGELKLVALTHDNALAANALEREGLDGFIGVLTKDRDAALKYNSEVSKLLAHAAEGEKNRQNRLDAAKIRAEATASGVDFTPESLEMYARAVADGGQMPYLGMGKASTEARIKISNRAADLREERGDSAGSLALKQMTYAADKAELTALQRQRGLVMSFAATTDRNLALVETLSRDVPRTEVPAINTFLLSTQERWGGDPKVAAFTAAVRTAINEYAGVVQRTGGTTDTARRHVEEMLNRAQTPAQIVEVVKLLRNEMKNRGDGYTDQIERIRQNSGEVTTAAPTRGSATPKQQIRRIGDASGTKYEAPAGTPVPSGFELVK